MDKNTNIIFTEKSDLAVEALLKNFGIEESYEEMIRRVQEKKLSNDVIISFAARGFAQGTLTEPAMIESLQKDIPTTPEKAKEISKEIISKVVPLLEKATEGQAQIPPPAPLSSPAEKPPLSPTLPQDKNEVSSEPEIKEKVLPKKVIPDAPIKNKPRGPDSYREPIE